MQFSEEKFARHMRPINGSAIREGDCESLYHFRSPPGAAPRGLFCAVSGAPGRPTAISTACSGMYSPARLRSLSPPGSSLHPAFAGYLFPSSHNI